MSDLELMEWALDVIEELDLMGRSQVTGYQMPQEDIAKKNALKERITELKEQARE